MRGVLWKSDKRENTLPKRFCLRSFFYFRENHDVKLPFWGHLQKNDSRWCTETWFQRDTAHFYTNSKTSGNTKLVEYKRSQFTKFCVFKKKHDFFHWFSKTRLRVGAPPGTLFFPNFRKHEKSYFSVSPLVSVSKMLKNHVFSRKFWKKISIGKLFR